MNSTDEVDLQTFGSLVAPGADDDGSGTSLLLSIARHISSHHLTFRRKVIIAAFSGEEQGLLGSNYFARKLKADGEDVALMVQAGESLFYVSELGTH